jgi:hypothetical protein
LAPGFEDGFDIFGDIGFEFDFVAVFIGIGVFEEELGKGAILPSHQSAFDPVGGDLLVEEVGGEGERAVGFAPVEKGLAEDAEGVAEPFDGVGDRVWDFDRAVFRGDDFGVRIAAIEILFGFGFEHFDGPGILFAWSAGVFLINFAIISHVFSNVYQGVMK